MILNFLLITFCVLSLIFSLLIIISRNPIHSILYLILVFCSVTFILIILGVEFIAITFLIVYVGAIAVLFLFVVMMLNIKILELDETFWKYLPIGFFIGSIFLFQILFLVFDLQWIDLFFGVNTSLSIKSLMFANDFTSISASYVNGIYSNFSPSEIPFNSNLKFIYNSYWVVLINSSNEYVRYLPFSSEFTNTELLGWLVYTYTFFIFLVVSLILLIAMIGSIVLVLNQNVNVKRQLIFKQTLKDLKSSVVLKN